MKEKIKKSPKGRFFDKIKYMKFKSINPTTEKIISLFELYSEEMIADVVKKAGKSFESWKNTDILKREKIIKNFFKILKRKKNKISVLITKEMGKPIIESEGEIDTSLGDIDWFLSETQKTIKDEVLKLDIKDTSARIRFEPLGTVGIITPWNFPIGTVIWKIIPALLAGNTIIFKPSELSTFCGLEIGKLLKEAGVPRGVFNVVTGDAKTGKYLVSSQVNMISFTGSSEAGKDVLSKAGKGLKKAVLELGGSDPFIVFKDALFKQAVNAAVFGRFLNCGQVCTAAKRIFIDKKIYNLFLERFTEKVRKLKVGDPLNRTTEIGPLVSKKQLEILDGQVKDAVRKGAKVIYGGRRIKRKGFFYQPTVLTGVKQNMRVSREEVFGPIASLTSFTLMKEAIDSANNTKYGLGASIWTQNKIIAEKMIKSIESGMIWVNDFGTPYPQCPQGGIKESGMGREMSKYGILEFCNMKTIVNSKVKMVKKPWWFPYNT